MIHFRLTILHDSMATFWSIIFVILRWIMYIWWKTFNLYFINLLGLQDLFVLIITINKASKIWQKICGIFQLCRDVITRTYKYLNWTLYIKLTRVQYSFMKNQEKLLVWNVNLSPMTLYYLHSVSYYYAVLLFYDVKCLCSRGREWEREESHSH